MFISYKTKLKLNLDQKKYLNQLFGNTRFLYNHLVSLLNSKDRIINIDLGKMKSYGYSLMKRKDFLTFTFKESVGKVCGSVVTAYKKLISNKSLLKLRKKGFKETFYASSTNLEVVREPKRKNDYIKLKGCKGLLKLFGKVRFKGTLVGGYFSFDGFDYFVSLVYGISKEEYIKTHQKHFNEAKAGVGIDLGVINNITLSCGVVIDLNKQLEKYLKKAKRMSKNLSRKVHSKVKGDGIKNSSNFNKYKLKIRKLHRKISYIRSNFIHQLSALLLKFFKFFCVEDLKIKELLQSRHSLASKLSQLPFYDFISTLTLKAERCGKTLIKADKYFPSSKLCCKCGTKNNYLTIFKRHFKCKKCGFIIDRDLNAAANLFKLLKNTVGAKGAEFKSVDLAKFFDYAYRQGLKISRVEAETCKNLSG